MRVHACIVLQSVVSNRKTGVQGLFELIGELSRRRYQIGERGFAKLGLNHTEARILSLLVGVPEAPTQDALSNRLTVDRSNAGRAMKALEQRGLIVREKGASDGRTYTVQLTDEGAQIAARIDQMRVEMARMLFPSLSDADADTLIGHLDRAVSVGEA